VKELDGPLREFVYLDEVSVYSLIASRRGPIVEQLTESQTDSLRSELTTSSKASAGVVTTGLGSRTEATRTSGSQVVRRSIIQATFKELFDLERDRLELRVTAEGIPEQHPRTANELNALASDPAMSGFLIEAADFHRGQLLEIEVELEAETIFRLSATVSSLVEMFKENLEMLPAADRPGLLEGMAVGRVLDTLLAGLVPVRGRAVDYRYVIAGDQRRIAHQHLLTELPADGDVVVAPLYVVGVAETDLFWKDIRRVLFSRARYTMLCRMAREGVQRSWTPVKLVDVLRDILPGVAAQVDAAAHGLLTAMEGAAATAQDDPRGDAIELALLGYSMRLVEHYGKEIELPDLATQSRSIAQALASDASAETLRVPFAAITERLRETYSLPTDRELEATYRFDALDEAGLVLDGNGFRPASTPDAVGSSSRVLDTEIVAIYW
jgi:hypothetical protein